MLEYVQAALSAANISNLWPPANLLVPAIAGLTAIQMSLIYFAQKIRSDASGTKHSQKLMMVEESVSRIWKEVARLDDAPSSKGTAPSESELKNIKKSLDDMNSQLQRLRDEAKDATRRADRMTYISLLLGIVSLVLTVVFFIVPYLYPPG